MELVALSRMFRRTITVYNEQQNGAVQEQLFQGHSYNERSSPTNERKTISNDVRHLTIHTYLYLVEIYRLSLSLSDPSGVL